MATPTSHLLSAASGLALACAGAHAADPAAAEIEQLIAINKQMQRAFVDRDVAVLEKIFTDDYVLVVSSGAEITRAQLLENVASPEAHWEINESRDWNIRINGDTAIVIATLHQKGVDHGKAFDSHVKFSDTYVRENGSWRNFHAHASKAVDVEKPAG